MNIVGNHGTSLMKSWDIMGNGWKIHGKSIWEIHGKSGPINELEFFPATTRGRT